VNSANTVTLINDYNSKLYKNFDTRFSLFLFLNPMILPRQTDNRQSATLE